MSISDEIRAITDPATVPVVFALERHASRRGRSWTIDFVVMPTVHPAVLALLDSAAVYVDHEMPMTEARHWLAAHEALKAGGTQPIYLRSLAAAAGFDRAEGGGNVIREAQVLAIDRDEEYAPMWQAMRETARAHVTAAGGDVGHLDEITPRWL